MQGIEEKANAGYFGEEECRDDLPFASGAGMTSSWVAQRPFQVVKIVDREHGMTDLQSSTRGAKWKVYEEGRRRPRKVPDDRRQRCHPPTAMLLHSRASTASHGGGAWSSISGSSSLVIVGGCPTGPRLPAGCPGWPLRCHAALPGQPLPRSPSLLPARVWTL